MNVEDQLRSELHSEANAVAPIDGLIEVSTQRGRRKQQRRRLAVAGTSVAAAAIVVGGSLAIAGSGSSGPRSQVSTAHGSSTPSAAGKSNVTPWWTTWPQNRHFGPIDQAFLTNARPTYGTETSPEQIKVWATGSEPDGTDWVLFTSPQTGHILNYLQGWNGQTDFGEDADHSQPGMTWATYFSPSLAAHNDPTGRINSQYMIIVGKPGTTSIKYAADGTTYTDLTVQDGIAVVALPNGFPAKDAKVELADTHGTYATGSPIELPDSPQGNGQEYGGTGEQSPSAGPGTSTPVATPTSSS